MRWKILDLCAGTRSVEKALDKMEIEYDYKGVDIFSPEKENIIFDLSSGDIVDRIKTVLGNWKPDFIWASPPCTTFSRATSIKGGTISYIVENGELRERERDEYKLITHKAYAKFNNDPEWINRQIEKGKVGINIMYNIKQIINYYNVPFAIENPAYATSRYILKEYTRNVTHYCMYGMPYKKATAIYTSKELKLKKCNHKKHSQVMSGWKSKTGIENAPSSNKDRSRVPEKLIVDIITQLGITND